MPAFDQLLLLTIQAEPSTEADLTVLRDVSSLLAMVSAVREGNIERHLQSERDT